MFNFLFCLRKIRAIFLFAQQHWKHISIAVFNIKIIVTVAYFSICIGNFSGEDIVEDTNIGVFFNNESKALYAFMFGCISLPISSFLSLLDGWLDGMLGNSFIFFVLPCEILFYVYLYKLKDSVFNRY